MVTEDYVSPDVAKLLKEKGFECATLHYYYDKDGDLLFSAWGVDAGKNEFVAPTLQMARKWLEEEKKLYVNVWAEPKDAENNDFRIVHRLQVFDGKTNYGTFEFPSHEKACEAGIRFCLENMI